MSSTEPPMCVCNTSGITSGLSSDLKHTHKEISFKMAYRWNNRDNEQLIYYKRWLVRRNNTKLDIPFMFHIPDTVLKLKVA